MLQVKQMQKVFTLALVQVQMYQSGQEQAQTTQPQNPDQDNQPQEPQTQQLTEGDQTQQDTTNDQTQEQPQETQPEGKTEEEKKQEDLQENKKIQEKIVKFITQLENLKDQVSKLFKGGEEQNGQDVKCENKTQFEELVSIKSGESGEDKLGFYRVQISNLQTQNFLNQAKPVVEEQKTEFQSKKAQLEEEKKKQEESKKEDTTQQDSATQQDTVQQQPAILQEQVSQIAAQQQPVAQVVSVQSDPSPIEQDQKEEDQENKDVDCSLEIKELEAKIQFCDDFLNFDFFKSCQEQEKESVFKNKWFLSQVIVFLVVVIAVVVFMVMRKKSSDSESDAEDEENSDDEEGKSEQKPDLEQGEQSNQEE